MLDKNDRIIISHSRANARKRLTEVSKKTGIPITTLFDRIRRMEVGVIEQYTCCSTSRNLDFTQMQELHLK